MDNLSDVSNIEIITSQGATLPIPKPNTNQIDISYLVRDIYILKIIKDGHIYTAQFLKE